VLGTVVDSADARPTDGSYAVFKVLSAQLDAQLARLEVITREDLAAFNASLVGPKLQPVK
jgi:BMFP domain-containing protein YqiC